MIADMVEFLLKLQNPKVSAAIKEYFSSMTSILDVFNIDLKFSANMNITVPDLEE